MAYSAETKEQALELHAAGKTVVEIADALGVKSFGTVANWVRAAQQPNTAIELPAETKTVVTQRLVDSVERFRGLDELEYLYGEAKKLIGQDDAALNNARIIAIAEKIATGIVKIQGQYAAPVEIHEARQFDYDDYKELTDENPA